MSNYQFFIKIIFFIIIFSETSCLHAQHSEGQKTDFSDKAMVVSAHKSATKAGLDILKKGGNAIDAAIAVQFALAVVYPEAGNIGGGGFLLLRKKNGDTDALDYREKAPAAATRNMYLDASGNIINGLSLYGHLAAGVPGSVDGMVKAFNRYSKLKNWKILLQPAIDLAENGIQISDIGATHLNAHQDKFKKYNSHSTVFTSEKSWKKGDYLVQKDLANTLKLIRDKGEAGFYEGDIAQQIVAEMKAGGGIITLADLKNYDAVWRKPMTFDYKNYTMIGMPPPSSGGIALQQLFSMIAPFPIAKMGFHSPEAIHLMVEAEKRVYADRATHLGDPDFFKVPVSNLLNTNYLAQRMNNFNPQKATPSTAIKAGNFDKKESEQTTHFSIVDNEGNAVAVTTTLNGTFGSHTVVSGAGFILNNEMDDFSSKPGVPNMYGLIGGEGNSIQANKRMLSSMTPTIVLKDKKLHIVVGTPGGSTIITSVFQTIVNIIEFGMSATKAVHSHRFHHQWLPDEIYIEEKTFSTQIRDNLQKMGHKLKEREYIGRVEAILIQSDGKIEGAADFRGDDDAEGW